MAGERQRWIPVGSGTPPEFVDFNGVDRIEYRESSGHDPERFVLWIMSGGGLHILGEVFDCDTIEHLKMEVGLMKRDMHFY